MKPHPKKIENVLRLDTQARCDYFVRKVADSEVVWGLFDTGWAIGTSDGHTVIPFWPEEDFSAMCASNEWKNFHPKAIALDEFMSRWLPGMETDRRLCAVFPGPEGKGQLLSPLELLELIKQELKQYE
uniref:DUF2750 domain-containing protein n=1 Tax=Burkholderia vietnamiensis TaxID=60552 RepID=UPI0009C07820|nr:DUF2750 domain-containing protein [Burkholderia vietnamiensis]